VRAKSVRKFDTFRKKRNVSDYDRSDAVPELEVEEMRKLAAWLRTEVEVWLGKNPPLTRAAAPPWDCQEERNDLFYFLLTF